MVCPGHLLGLTLQCVTSGSREGEWRSCENSHTLQDEGRPLEVPSAATSGQALRLRARHLSRRQASRGASLRMTEVKDMEKPRNLEVSD